MPTFKLIIEYDGTAYHGWQRQKTDPTIQAGVHALGQAAHFRADTRIDPQAFLKGLNRLLPADIVIRECAIAPDDFHARFHVRAKHYRYRILNRPLPAAIGRHYAWHIRRPLEITPMNRAAAVLCGTHDFKAFEGTGSPRASTLRTIQRAEMSAAANGHLIFDIEGNGFLRFMVRNIVGTLVEIGGGKRPAADMPALLAGRDRSRVGATAPACGLCLMKVSY